MRTLILTLAWVRAELLETPSGGPLASSMKHLCVVGAIDLPCHALGFRQLDRSAPEDGGDAAERIGSLVSVRDYDVARLLQAVGLQRQLEVAPAPFSCAQLCEATGDYLGGLGYVLPPRPHVACLDLDCTMTVDVSPSAAASLARHDLQMAGPLAYGQDALTQFSRVDTAESGAVAEDAVFSPFEEPPALPRTTSTHDGFYTALGDDASFDASFDAVYPQGPDDVHEDFVFYDAAEEPEDLLALKAFAPEDLARHLAVLFGVYVLDRPEASMHALLEVDAEAQPRFAGTVPHEKKNVWNEYALKGEALVSAALTNLDARPDVVARWFGSAFHTPFVKTLLNQVLRTMMNLKITMGGADVCEGRTLAYVMVSRSFDGAFVGSERENDESGREMFNVNVCDHFWEASKQLSYRYGTLIHEASHHHGPKDVLFAPDPERVPAASALTPGLKVVLHGLTGDLAELNGKTASVKDMDVAVDQVAVTLKSFRWNPQTGQAEDRELALPRDHVRLGATAYGVAMCQKLVELQPQLAVDNADNFMWAVIELAAEAVRAPGEWPCDIWVQPAEAAPATHVQVEVYCTEAIRGGRLDLRSATSATTEFDAIDIEPHVGYVKLQLRGDRDSSSYEFTAQFRGQRHTIVAPPLVPVSPCTITSSRVVNPAWVADGLFGVSVSCVGSNLRGLALSARSPNGELVPLGPSRVGGRGGPPTQLLIETPSAAGHVYQFQLDPHQYSSFELTVESHGRRYQTSAPALTVMRDHCDVTVTPRGMASSWGPVLVARRIRREGLTLADTFGAAFRDRPAAVQAEGVVVTAKCREPVADMRLRVFHLSGGIPFPVESPLGSHGGGFATLTYEISGLAIGGHEASVTGLVGQQRVRLWHQAQDTFAGLSLPRLTKGTRAVHLG